MKFVFVARVESCLQQRFGAVTRTDRDLSCTLQFAQEDVSYTVHAPENAAVGRGVYTVLQLTATHPQQPTATDAADQNRLNRLAPFVVTSQERALSMHFPVAAAEIDSEADLLAVIDMLAGGRMSAPRPFGVSQQPSRRLFLSDGEAELGTLEKVVAGADRGRVVVVPSREPVLGGMYFLNVLVPEPWIEQVGIYEQRHALSYENIYDIRFEMLYDDIKRESRDDKFKQLYAAKWNRDHAMKHWRLRAHASGGRFVFSTPLVTWKQPEDTVGTTELEALQIALASRFHLPSISFSPPPIDAILMPVMRKVAWFAFKKAIGL